MLLQIASGFGIGKVASASLLAATISATAPTYSRVSGFVAAPAAEHKVYGTVEALAGTTLVIRTRSGRMVTVDGHLAQTFVHLFRNRPIIVFGTTDGAGVMHARAIWRTFPDSAHWPADR